MLAIVYLAALFYLTTTPLGVLVLPLVLGLEPKELALLMVTFLTSVVTLGSGRTHMMQGAVHLVIFAAFLFLAFVP